MKRLRQDLIDERGCFRDPLEREEDAPAQGKHRRECLQVLLLASQVDPPRAVLVGARFVAAS